MLTIEQLRAMPESDRSGYIAQQARQCMQDDERAAEFRRDALELRERATASDEAAAIREGRAAEARAYFATLTAAGLWPLPAPTEGR